MDPLEQTTEEVALSGAAKPTDIQVLAASEISDANANGGQSAKKQLKFQEEQKSESPQSRRDVVEVSAGNKKTTNKSAANEDVATDPETNNNNLSTLNHQPTESSVTVATQESKQAASDSGKGDDDNNQRAASPASGHIVVDLVESSPVVAKLPTEAESTSSTTQAAAATAATTQPSSGDKSQETASASEGQQECKSNKEEDALNIKQQATVTTLNKNTKPTIVLANNNNSSSSGSSSSGKKQPPNHSTEANISFPTTKLNHNYTTTSNNNLADVKNNLRPPYCKRQRLSYLQTLLLRRWPCFAIGVCIMSSLIFGVLLSALTVYFMHGVTDCSGLAALAAAHSHLHHAHHNLRHESPHLLPPHELLGHPSDFEAPLDVAALATGGSGSAVSAAAGEGSVSSAAANAELDARSFGEGSGGERPRFQRLPTSLVPIHYDLFVQPYIAEPFNFTGRVSIRIRCTEATDNITLHSLDLDLDDKSLNLQAAPQEAASAGRPVDGRDAGAPASRLAAGATTNALPKVVGLSQDKQLQYSIVKLDKPLVAGEEYVLTMDFVGTLNDDLAGFYRIRYDRQNSNESTSPDGMWITDTFAKSHRMSTYLVAYAVTNFESRSEGNISVWTRPGFVHTADYALKIAGKILRHYEEFFGIEYPLPKMDMIALPDFNAGAMENWGLITYRETAMLYDENSSSIANKQRIAVVVAHELAHQWFGNLVTPKWWDDLWLNEGFASFVEYIGVDHVEPKWRMLDQFVVEEVQNVFKMDGLSSSHQISIPVNNPDEISEIFDHISYAKGASIIRMMNHFLTDSVFKSGLQRYLRALKYSNAEQSDLWAHLTEAQRLASASSVGNNKSTIDVERVMNSWTLQTGFPLVTLTRNYETRSARLDQIRYQAFRVTSNSSSDKSLVPVGDNKTSVGSESAAQKWEIPVTFTWKSEQNWQPTTRIWMHQNDTQPTELGSALVPKSADEWMLLNVQQVGYYRVNYDLRNWRLLIDQLNADHGKISTTNRAQILDDIFELAKSAMIDYRFAMEATKYLKGERDYLPWDTVLMSFSYIDDMLQRTAIYGDWKDYIADLIAPYYARYKDLDWTVPTRVESSTNASTVDTNDVLEQYNQVNAIAWACQVNEHCIKKAKSVFAHWKQSGRNQINPALRYTTYCTAIENGDKEDWNFLWRAYEREQNASERDRIMRSLGCSREIWILSRYLDWTFNKTKPIRRQDGAYVFRMIAKNNYGRDIAFNFMRERWSTIKEYYGKTSFSLGNLIRSVSTSMNTQVELNQLMNFYESIKADVGTGKRSFQIAIEEVESNVAWRNRNYKIIEDWIQEERSKSGKPQI